MASGFLSKMTGKAALTLTVAFLGCADADQLNGFKAPSNVTVEFLLQESVHPHLDFTKGFISINSFEFTGLRDNADDVHFTRPFPTGFDSQLALTTIGAPMQEYDIPQGHYNKIEIKLELFAADDSQTTLLPGLWVEGNFVRSDDTIVPMRVEIAADANVTIDAVSDTGTNDITLLHSSPTTAKIAFSAPNWFGSVSMSALEAATLTEIDGKMVLLISKNTNPDLYAIALSNLDESTQGVFMLF
jgi:hypothetical protein